jgi:dynein heavy chain
VWTLAREYEVLIPNIMDGQLNGIDRDQITKDVIEAIQDLFMLEKKIFKTIPHMMIVSQNIRKKYETFQPNLPIINNIRNPALRKRHWKRLSEMLGLELDEDANISFRSLLERVLLHN